MQPTVNFHCPHCGNLMAVGTNLLGRNVRCPHCKQVVRAPAAAGDQPAGQVAAPQAPPLTPPPPPQFRVPAPGEHHESIFGERHDEDLFGSEPLKPRMPVETVAAPPPLPEPVYAPPPPPTPAYDETQAYVPPPDYAPAPPEVNDALRPPAHDEAPADLGYRPRPVPLTESAGTPAFAWILLAYSVLITAVAGVLAYLYLTAEAKGDHPFKAIPDFYGKYEKATGAEHRKQLSFQGMPDPKLTVPPDLRVKLGEELTVGAVRVRPERVIQQPVELVKEHATRENTTNGAGEGLILMLNVKNVSTDTTLHPDDPAFNRAFDKNQPPPYTALQIGREVFYGPFAWPPEPELKDAYLKGFRPADEPLGPGQERDIPIPVAPSGFRVAEVGDAIGTLDLAKKRREDPPLLWRVQLRRGFVKATTDDGREVDVSATTVIGVEFTADQIKHR